MGCTWTLGEAVSLMLELSFLSGAEGKGCGGRHSEESMKNI